MTDQKKKFWSMEMMVAMASIFVGFCALAITAVQTYIMREQQYASVWPSVTFGTGNGNINDRDSTASFEMTIWNKGIGPAIIKDLKIICRGVMYDDSQRQLLFQAMAGTREQVPFGYASIGKNRVVQAGENIPWCQFSSSHKSYKVAKAMENGASGGFKVIIFYSDIYGNTWVVRGYDQTEECNGCEEEVLKGYTKYTP